MTKLKNSNWDKIKKKRNCDKNQKLIMWQNSKCDNTQKLKLWKNSNHVKNWIVTKLRNSNWDKTQKPKLWQKSKSEIVKKLYLWQNLKTPLVWTNWHLDNRWDVFGAVQIYQILTFQQKSGEALKVYSWFFG